MAEDRKLEGFLNFMEKLRNYEKSSVPKGAGTDSADGFDLGRMRRLLQRLGNPHSNFKGLIQDANVSFRMKVLACPICFDALFSKTGASISLASTSGSSVECNTCKKGYRGNDAYLDLTLSGSSMDYDETMPAATELFRSPLVSFLYERGWRQNFVWGGFPGPEREFEMAKDFLKPTFGGTIIDASCGSGLFSRLFAKSELYSLVVALDYSENMLRQCYEFTNQDNISKENLLLIRADISRLPFIAGSIDAVHAGAALHCWPSPSAAVNIYFQFRFSQQNLKLCLHGLSSWFAMPSISKISVLETTILFRQKAIKLFCHCQMFNTFWWRFLLKPGGVTSNQDLLVASV